MLINHEILLNPLQSNRQIFKNFLLYFTLIFLTACGGGGGGGSSEPDPVSVTRTVTLNWTANKESRVNQNGGGYRVYYSSDSGFDINDAGVTQIDVPFVSGSNAPTSVALNLASGIYYFKIVAYGDFLPGAISTSNASNQLMVNVPFG